MSGFHKTTGRAGHLSIAITIYGDLDTYGIKSLNVILQPQQ